MEHAKCLPKRQRVHWTTRNNSKLELFLPQSSWFISHCAILTNKSQFCLIIRGFKSFGKADAPNFPYMQGRIKVVWGLWLKLRKGPYSCVRRKFSWEGSLSGIWCSFVCGVRFLWRHNLTSYSCFQTNVWRSLLI